MPGGSSVTHESARVDNVVWSVMSHPSISPPAPDQKPHGPTEIWTLWSGRPHLFVSHHETAYQAGYDSIDLRKPNEWLTASQEQAVLKYRPLLGGRGIVRQHDPRPPALRPNNCRSLLPLQAPLVQRSKLVGIGAGGTLSIVSRAPRCTG
jgi:hypothetical protein